MKQKTILSCVLFLFVCCIPSMAQDFTTPEKSGYTLIRTNTIEGIKCDHYLENVRTFRFDNGDFVSFKEGDQGYEDKKPFDRHFSIGSWRMTKNNGAVCEYEADKKQVTVTFPNGAILICPNARAGVNRGWNTIVPGDYYGPDLSAFCKPKSTLKLPRSNVELVYEKNGDIKGFVDERRMRVINITADGVCLPTYKIINNAAIFCNEEDSIIDFNRENNEIRYANGDHIKLGEGEYKVLTIKEGSIHRNGGVLTVKEANGKTVMLLTYGNGDKFAGEFKTKMNEGDSYYYLGYPGTNLETIYNSLYFPELIPWNGTYIKTDGKTIQYKEGKTEQQIAAENKAKEAKATALYNDLSKKYGKQYVDAALKQLPIVGMPEELLKAAFNLKFVRQSGDWVLYRITGLGWKNFGMTLSDNVLLYSIWVRNGRVVDVRYWGN